MYIRTKTIKTGAQSKGLPQHRERKPRSFCYCIVTTLFSLNSLNLNAHAVTEESSQNKEEKYRIIFHHFLYKNHALGASEYLSGELPEPLLVNQSSESPLAEQVKYLNYPENMFVAFDRRNPAITEPYHALKLFHNDLGTHFRHGYSTYPFSGSYETAGKLPGTITLSSSCLIDFKKNQWPLLPGKKNILPYFPFAEPVDLLLLVLERKSENPASGAGTSANSETLASSLSSSFYHLFKPHKPFYPGSQGDSLIDIDVIPAYINPFLLLFANQAEQPQKQQIVLRIIQADGTEEIKTISRTAFASLTQRCPISEPGFWRYLFNVEARVFIRATDLSAQCRLQTQQVITRLENSWLPPVMRETPRKKKRESKQTTPPRQQQESSSGSGQPAPEKKENKDDKSDDLNADDNPPPTPGNSGNQPADADDQQVLVDALVKSAGKGYTRDMKEIINKHGKELLYLKHSDRDVLFSGDTPLHAATRYDQKDSIIVIEQQTSDQEMAQLWEITNHEELTPRELKKIFQSPPEAKPEEKESELSLVVPVSESLEWPELKAEPTPPITQSKPRKKGKGKKTARKEKEIDEIMAFIEGTASIPVLGQTSLPPEPKSSVRKQAAIMEGLGVVPRKQRFGKKGMSDQKKREEACFKQLELATLTSLEAEALSMRIVMEESKKNKIRISDFEEVIQEALDFKVRYEEFCNQPENISYKNLTIQARKNFEQHQIRTHLNIRQSFTIFYETYLNEHENYNEEIKKFFNKAPDNQQEIEHYLNRMISFQSSLIENMHRTIMLAEHLSDYEGKKELLEVTHKFTRQYSQNAGILIDDIQLALFYYPELYPKLHTSLCNDFDYNSNLLLPSWRGVKDEHAFRFWTRLLFKHKELSRGRHLVEIIEGFDLNNLSKITIPGPLEAMLGLLTNELKKLEDESLSLPVRASSLKVLAKAKSSAIDGWLANQTQVILPNFESKMGWLDGDEIYIFSINLLLSRFQDVEQEFYARIEQEREILAQKKKEEVKQLLKEEAEDKQREADKKKIAAQIKQHLIARKERKASLLKSESTTTSAMPQTETEQIQVCVESVQENPITDFIRETSQVIQYHAHEQYQLILSECHDMLTQDISPEQAAMLNLYMAEIHIDLGISLINRINRGRERIIQYNDALKATGQLPQQGVYHDFRGVILELPKIEKKAQHHLDSTNQILDSVYIPENGELESSYLIIKESFQTLVKRLQSIEEKKKLYDMQQIIELRKELIDTTRKPQANAQKTSGITYKAIKDAALCDEKISEMVPKWKAVLDKFEAQTSTIKQ